MTEDRRTLDQQLEAAAEAADAEWAAEPEPRLVRARRPGRDPAQVYSVRIPVEDIARLRQRADEDGVKPTVLMRRWVLERLASEPAPAISDEPPPSAEPAPRSPARGSVRLGARRRLLSPVSTEDVARARSLSSRGRKPERTRA